MELRHLKYFAKVAELKNFSEAAKVLCVTQSTLSQQIKKLEDELNVTLLLRDSHHVRLTDVGEAVLPAILKTINEANSCMDLLHDVQDLSKGTLNVGSTLTFSPLLRDTVLSFNKHYPGIKLNLFCKSMEELMEMLVKDEIDVALSFKPTQSYDNVESKRLFDNQLCAVVSDSHPLASQNHIRLSDLERYQLALPSRGLQARNTFDAMIGNLNLDLNIIVEINEISILMDIVRNSRFITFLSDVTVRQQKGLVTLPIAQDGTNMEGCFHYLKGSYHKRATREFVRMICENQSYRLALMTL
ncbi:MAG: LysR substrate-binding domain-containing protein [Bacteroidaceae bacterium]|nr:LysR substrate-binding domain-containing protein [Bacteroidaceae bacterium]